MLLTCNNKIIIMSIICYGYSLSEIMHHGLIIQTVRYVHATTRLLLCSYCNYNNSLCLYNIVLTDIILSLNVGDDLKSVEQILRIFYLEIIML